MDSKQEMYRKQADQGQRAFLALEYVKDTIETEMSNIHMSLLDVTRTDTELLLLVKCLQAYNQVKNTLILQHEIGTGASKKLGEGEIE